MLSCTNIATNTPFKPKESSRIYQSSRITEKQLVNAFHPVVQELVKAEYSLDQSIEAVEYDERLEEAMDYLLSCKEEGVIFQSSLLDQDQDEDLQQEIVL